MKNKFLLLLILGVTFFASCSDDDDDKVRNYNGDKLTLSVGGINFSDREALPGENETVFTVVREGNKITGVNSNANREVALNGTIDGDKLGLNLTLKVKSSMKAKWSVKGLFFNVEPQLEEGNEKDMVDFVAQVAGALVPMLMPSISFEEDGNIIATYIKDMSASTPEYINSPEGMALYNVVDNKIYIALNIGGIVEDASTPKAATSSIGRSDYNPLQSLISMAETGIPLYLRDGEAGVKEVYLDRETLLPVVKMLPTLLATFGDQLGELKEYVTGLVQTLATVIENSTKTEIGLQLAPYTETPTPAANVQSFSKMIENAGVKFVK